MSSSRSSASSAGITVPVSVAGVKCGAARCRADARMSLKLGTASLDKIVEALIKKGYTAEKVPGPLLMATTGGKWPVLKLMPPT